jgi:processive 1,2-diacylglycerol beta-glucosyltransferase
MAAETAAPRRVLVMTLAFGSGHARAASAIAGEVRRQAPGVKVLVVDALGGSRPIFRALYVWPYWFMVRYAPRLWRRLFWARIRNTHRQTAPGWAFGFGCPAVFRTLTDFDPDVIVAAEVGATEIAAHARRRGLTAAPIVSVITDHHAEPAWVQPEVGTYAVADVVVRAQLIAWGARAESVVVAGIPTDAGFQLTADRAATRARHGLHDDRPLVLLMGGGMGPTRMDRVAAGLCATGRPIHVVAVAGHDRRARRRLDAVRGTANTTLMVRGWIDDVPALMQSAAVLVTKPGGVTCAEAAACGVPVVMFDPIPGPEEHNAERLVQAGAGVLAHGSQQTAAAVLGVLDDHTAREDMAKRIRAIGSPSAAATIAEAVLGTGRGRPVLILTIANGAGHTRVADAIAQALTLEDPATPVTVVDVADYMSIAARLTHVTLYLWLVKYAPRLWDRIDRYQKRQPHTSPEWYYRRGCARLFDLVRRTGPRVIVATEVGCAEIAALIKRDLGLAVPLVAVNGEYDADRAWVQPEVDAYCVPTAAVADELFALGAARGRVHDWGVPLAGEFDAAPRRERARADVCRRLGLSSSLPIVLVGGGSEGLGRPDLIARRLLGLEGVQAQIVVLAGKNASVKARCERVVAHAPERVRVLGWTSQIGDLMHAADLMVSKPGHTFDEAIASGLPLVSLPPPPGSERVQYRLLDEWNVGRGVRDLDELDVLVTRLLGSGEELAALRRSALQRARPAAARAIAQWIRGAASAHALDSVPAASPRLVAAEGRR